MPGKHAKHNCYRCSCTIPSGEPEVEVPGAGYPKRYQHATEEACREALNRIQHIDWGVDPQRWYEGKDHPWR